MVALSALGAGPAFAQESLGGVDKAINDALGPFASWISGIVFWAPPIENFPPLIVLWMIGAGVFFTFYLKFINVRGFKHSIDITRGAYDDPDDPGETTHFQALMTALSATVGLGNIAGVAVAISIGGPGATFWMIVAAIFGMTLKFTECSLALKYRHEWEDGQVSGGPMYYLDIGLQEKGWPKWAAKFCAGFFAFATIGAAVGAANMFQVGQARIQFLEIVGQEGFFANNAWVFGVIFAIVVGIVIIGGIKSIARVTEKLVPFMAGLYIAAGLVIIALNISEFLPALGSIIGGAFTGQAAAGGVVGAFVTGIQRAAFSNEAGLGSAAIAHSSAKTDLWIREGFVAQLGPVIDTIIVCTVTASVIVITGVYEGGEGAEGVSLTSEAFGSSISWFPQVLSVAVILFAFSTIISWSYYAVKASNYLFGESTIVVRSTQLLFLFFVVLGSALSLENVVPLMDALIFLMPVMNILGLYVLGSEVKKGLADYWDAFQSGEMQTYAQEQEAQAGAGT